MGFLARVTQRIGRALVSFGLGGDGGAGPPPTVAIVSVCGDIDTARSPRATTRTAPLIRDSVTVETRVDGATRTAPRIVGRIDVSEC